jgi:hypothetical protein
MGIPELDQLLTSSNRLGVIVNQKTGIFKLEMVVWPLAKTEDVPECEERQLRFAARSE